MVAGQDVLDKVAAQVRPVHLGRALGHDPGEFLDSVGQHLRQLSFKLGAQRGLALDRGREPLDVSVVHPGKPVQPLRRVRRPRGNDRRSGRLRQPRRTRQRMGAPTGPAQHQSSVNLQVLQDLLGNKL